MTECLVCFENKILYTLECEQEDFKYKHKLCMKCINHLKTKNNSIFKCPFCRSDVNFIIKPNFEIIELNSKKCKCSKYCIFC